MRDPGLAELESALVRFCDEVLSDFTFPTREGMRRQVHWRYRGREFRANVLLPHGSEEFSPHRFAQWRMRGQYFDQLSSQPVFEYLEGPFDWQTAPSIRFWHWALTTAGRSDAADDSPGDLTGRPVRPRPGLPSLSAGAVAIPEPLEREDSRYPVALLPRDAAGSDRANRVSRWL